MSSKRYALSGAWSLVGKYAWYDAVFGAPNSSDVVVPDFSRVSELREHFDEYKWIYEAKTGSRTRLLDTLRELAQTAANEAEKTLRLALARRKLVIFATHVPPFPGACWHMGKLSNAAWMPWFTCDAMGKMLERVAAAHPQNRIVVLCGHTHSPGAYKHTANLHVLTGRAVYGAPDVSALLVTTELL